MSLDEGAKEPSNCWMSLPQKSNMKVWFYYESSWRLRKSFKKLKYAFRQHERLFQPWESRVRLVLVQITCFMVLKQRQTVNVNVSLAWASLHLAKNPPVLHFFLERNFLIKQSQTPSEPRCDYFGWYWHIICQHFPVFQHLIDWGFSSNAAFPPRSRPQSNCPRSTRSRSVWL